jgi:deoxyribonuclease-4
MIRIGPAGFGGTPSDMIDEVAALGVDAVEIPFTYNVFLSNEQSDELRELNRKYGLSLSIHAPYFINLAAKEPHKVEASKKRILDSCERAHHMGAKYVVFHAGFYLGRDNEMVYQQIKDAVLDIMSIIRGNGWDVLPAPETTGKATQFGTLDELVRLKDDTGCHICVDFSHIKARNIGHIDYDDIMRKLKHLGHIHAHFSGIEWTAKGERRHLVTEEEDIRELLGHLLKYDIDITIINESPDMFADAQKMIRILGEMV